MLAEAFVAIGHISNDINPKPHLGGGVSYSAVTAARLGLDSHIYTKCRGNDPYIDELKKMGVASHILRSSMSITTSFDNRYDEKGNRTQIVGDVQEPITSQDIDELNNIPKGAIILAAPIIGEVDMSLFALLAEIGTLGVTPQGYFRGVEPGGIVRQKKWEGFQEPLSKTKGVVTVLSTEDMTIDGKLDESLRNEIVQASSTVAVTEGNKGATVYKNGEEACHINAFPLSEGETVDFTGAGDIFATVFITEMAKNNGNIQVAALAACFFAALKIKSISNGIGLKSIPTVQQVREFVHDESKRVDYYLQSEGVDTEAILFLHKK